MSVRAAHTLPSALAAFESFLARIGSRRPAFFLDFDGTLTPIMPRPDMARLAEPVRAVIAALAERHSVAVVSGRDRAEIERLIGLPEILYAGNHGFDIVLPNGRRPGHGDMTCHQSRLDRVAEDVRRVVPDCLIERKRFTIAVHSRNVPETRVPAIEAAIVRVLAKEHPHLKLTTGKMVYELQPNLDWDKGRAVLWMLEELGLNREDTIPVFFGDDVTDERAFERLEGLGVVVAPATDHTRMTAADFRVEDCGEVVVLLQRLHCSTGATH